MQGQNLPQDIPQRRNRLHRRNPVFGALRGFEGVSQAGAGMLLHGLDGHAEDIVALHQAALAQADGAFGNHLAVEQRADRFKVEHHAAFHVAHEHRDGLFAGFALGVDGRTLEFFQEAVIDPGGLFAVVQKGDRFAVGQAQDQDLGIPFAEFAEDGGFAEAVCGAVGGDFIGVRPDRGHRVDRVEHAFGAWVFAHDLGQHAHLRGAGAHIPGGAAQEVVVEGRHDQRAAWADDRENSVDHGLRPALHAAGGARECGIGAVDKNGIAFGHAEGAEFVSEGCESEHEWSLQTI